MPSHDYTAREALDLLIRKLSGVNPAIADRIEVAVNAGTEVSIPGPRTSGRRKRTFVRKTRAFTDEEALQEAMNVLRSHLIETRLFARSAHEEFLSVGAAEGAPTKSLFGKQGSQEELSEVGQRKEIEIEQEPETVQVKKQLPNHRLDVIADQSLDSLEQLFAELQDLTEFD